MPLDRMGDITLNVALFDKLWGDLGGGAPEQPPTRAVVPHAPAKTRARHALATPAQEKMRNWNISKRPKNTNRSYKQGARTFERFCAKTGNDPDTKDPGVVADCLRHVLEEEGLGKASLGQVVAGLFDLERDSPANITHHPLVKDTLERCKKLAPPTRHTKEISREVGRALFAHMSRSFLKAQTPRGQLIVVRDIVGGLLVYKGLLRPDSVASLIGAHVSVETFDRELGPEPVAMILVEGGKGKDGEEHTALVAAGRELAFDLTYWVRVYDGLEKAYRATLRGTPERPATLIYNPAKGKDFGKQLSPTTISSRLKKYLREIGQAGVNVEGLTAYGLRVAGVSQALRAGVQERIIKRHGNWKSDAVRFYMRDEPEALLAVSDAL
jgi:hypothetical protein